ncbi:MAG TPA: PspC domain-containing protein [Candidatus Paceibacterota bacterium]|nr:PspC domain-containing protein [Candidatus Paceibacterota bacterium]
MKKLYRSRENRIFAGVLGGLGEYFNIDPVILRLAYLLIIIFSAIIPGVIVYIIAAIIIPEASTITHVESVANDAEEA